jgi:hypothetical protein
MNCTNRTNVSHIRGAAGAMRKVSEHDLDARIAELDTLIRENRERHDDAFDHMGQQLALRRALSRPAVIPLDSSLLARLIRWARATVLSLRGPL